MLLSFGPSLPLAVALLTHTIRNQVYALPSQQQQVLSQFAGAEVNGEGKEAHGLLRRFLAKDVDVQEVLQFALVRLNTNSYRCIKFVYEYTNILVCDAYYRKTNWISGR